MSDRLGTLWRKMAAMRDPVRMTRRRRNRMGHLVRTRSAHKFASMSRGWACIVRRDPCVFCGLGPGERGQTLEHVEPVAAGGGPEWYNLAGACKRCNQAKGDTPLLLFMLGRERERRRRLALEAARSRPPAPLPPTRPLPRHAGFKFADVIRWR